VQTNRTIPDNKLDIIIHENGKGTCLLIAVAISGDSNVIKKEAEIPKYKDLTTHVECKSKNDTGNKRGDWNHLIIIQRVFE
jgi:hypothetical protein